MENIEKIKLAETESQPKQQAEDVKITQDDAQCKVYGYDIFVSESTLKEYYKSANKLMILSNLLVGKVDDKGNYIISKEIKRDLVVMDKEIEDFGENFFKATNIYMKKHFFFNVHMSVNGEGKAKASLYLTEYVGEFKKEEYIVSHIADYIDDYTPMFKDKVRKAFNLVDVDLPNDDLKTPSLAVLMQRLLDEQIRVGELYEIAHQIYLMRMLQALETGGEICKRVLDRYRKLLLQSDEEKEKFSNVRRKALLDQAINEEGGLKKLDIAEESKNTIIGEMVKSLTDIEKKSAGVEVEEKVEKKEEKKAAGASKGKSGGGAKKKAGGKSGGGAKKKAGGAAKKPEKKGGPKRVTGNLSMSDYKRALNAGKPSGDSLDEIKKDASQNSTSDNTRPTPTVKPPKDGLPKREEKTPQEKTADFDEFDEIEKIQGVNSTFEEVEIELNSNKGKVGEESSLKVEVRIEKEGIADANGQSISGQKTRIEIEAEFSGQSLSSDEEYEYEQ